MKPRILFDQSRIKQRQALKDRNCSFFHDECGVSVELTKYDYGVYAIATSVKPELEDETINHRFLIDANYDFVAIRKAIATFDDLIVKYPQFQYQGEPQ